MPFINIKTNASVTKENAENIKSALGSAITAIPGKSESWLMAGIEGDYALYFKGTDEPAAMVEVQIYGSPSGGAMSELAGKITEIVSDSLGVPADRIYVSYMCTENWGWNGSNF
ncbi:MAG: phenylpyruvate tautomerase MIF-related protein [Ruminococcus sp.]|nr:phenylpyruvate tautomerase MIF-related protein [Ruminococcus sp.]